MVNISAVVDGGLSEANALHREHDAVDASSSRGDPQGQQRSSEAQEEIRALREARGP